jgi:hypothetical protein
MQNNNDNPIGLTTLKKYYNNHKVKGLIIGGILAIMFFIAAQKNGFEAVRSTTNAQFSIIFIGALASAYLFGLSSPKKYTFGNIFAHAFKTIGVAIIIVIAYYIIDHYLLHPNLKLEALADFQKQLDAIPKTEMDEAHKLEKLRIYENNYLISGRISPTLLFYAAIGALGSLIGAGFASKKD